MDLGAWKSRDDDKRLLTIKVKSLSRALKSQQQARRESDKKVKQLELELRAANKEIENLKKNFDEVRRQRDDYREIIFKPGKKPARESKSDDENKESPSGNKNKTNRGGQKGHKGHSRPTPPEVDFVERVYLTNCPDCSSPINRTSSVKSHTVEDLPSMEEIRKRIVRYETELQWCGNCRKLVKAKIKGVIPKSRFGLNLLLYVLIQKYFVRSTWDKVVDSLAQWYDITVSKGSLVGMVHRARQWMGDDYERILKEIKTSPVKHADETSWRVNAIGHWVWGFFTNKHAYYHINESRGKGIPQKMFEGCHPEDVLVRDDYAGYTKLKMKHQSCWAHLLRKSHQEATDQNASAEVKKLHNQLKTIFPSLNKIVNKPFHENKRKLAHERFANKIKKIISTEFKHDDTKRIQTRIANQNKNLITALLYPDTPLTNNLAERYIRPMVVTRKISGGSRSDKGAETHAVNMSIIQTLKMQKKPLVPSIKKIIQDYFYQN